MKQVLKFSYLPTRFTKIFLSLMGFPKYAYMIFEWSLIRFLGYINLPTIWQMRLTQAHTMSNFFSVNFNTVPTGLTFIVFTDFLGRFFSYFGLHLKSAVHPRVVIHRVNCWLEIPRQFIVDLTFCSWGKKLRFLIFWK